MRLLIKNKINVLHVDSVIVAEAPKVAPFIPLMKEALGRLLNLPGRSIGIKAKTNEGLGLIGQGEAIACWATALVMGGARRKQQG
jgi:2-C-methyl-D-erythritol 2,4-cyclodiphosphate synthase